MTDRTALWDGRWQVCRDVVAGQTTIVGLGHLPPAVRPLVVELLTAADDASPIAAERTEAAGDDAARRAGVDGLHPEIVRTLGRLLGRAGS